MKMRSILMWIVIIVGPVAIAFNVCGIINGKWFPQVFLILMMLPGTIGSYKRLFAKKEI